MKDRRVVLVAGVGDLGKYICEELDASDSLDVAVLSRTENHKWCIDRSMPVYATDYKVESLVTIFNITRATTVISLINLVGSEYLKVHMDLLAACRQSATCKRIIPSEWIGDSEKFPGKPRYYASSRGPFREILEAQTEVKWTLFNIGWIADYFLPEKQTYMKSIQGKFPIDQSLWSACIRGTGDEPQSWICGREVGKAVVELCKAGSWETHTYVTGDWKTFNEAVQILEDFHGRRMPRTYKSKAGIDDALAKHANEEELSEANELAQIEEMMILGCLSCPKEKTLRQRENYFSQMNFSSLDELLSHAKTGDFV